MATTLNLPFKRFIAQVSSGAPRPKSTYVVLMKENLDALMKCPWREAADVPADLTGHDFTASTQFSDAYDAFKLTGNYDSKAMTEIAYAGMVAYRFELPAAAVSGGVSITSVTLPISRDRFEKSGVHLAVALSNSAMPSSDWSVVRGSGDLVAAAQLEQMNVASVVAGAPGSGTVTIDLSGVTAGNPSAYLWVYVTLEDYTDTWAMYNAREKRLYAIEGSAALVGGSVDVAFSADVLVEDVTLKYITDPIPVHVTHYEGYHRTLRPRMCFTALSVLSGYDPFRSGRVDPLPEKSMLLPVASWTIPAGSYDLPFDHMLPTAGFRMPEGDYIIECWIDDSGSDKFVPGEPYGCTRRFGLSASATPERMEIVLTEVHPGMPRWDLTKLIEGMPSASARPEGDTPEPYPVSDSDFAKLAAATDRGRWGLPWAAIEPSQYPGTRAPISGSLLTRVRVCRNKINDADSSGGNSYCSVLLDLYFELSERSVLTEADFLATGRINDLDWGVSLVYGGALSLFVSTNYRVVIGEEDVGEYELNGNNLPVLFSNAYEALDVQTPTTPDASLANAEYTGRPMFRWTHDNTIGKAYPAFRCRIYADSGKQTKVYDSAVLRAPPRDANGLYWWTAPIAVGDTTSEGVTIQAGTTYYWSVSMLDAKFTGFGVNEVVTPFSFAAV